MNNINHWKRGWVTAIIPTYNRAYLIENTIQSVFNQTYPHWDLIVVDDGSTDDTVSILNKFDRQRITYLPIPHSGMPAIARNEGIKVAQGEYIAFLDSDDQWLPEKLEKQIAVLKKHLDVGLVHANALVKTMQQTLGRPYHSDNKRKSGKVLLELIHGNFVITSTVVVRRQLLDAAGLFRIDPAFRAGEDYDLWLRMAALSGFFYLENALAIYHDEPDCSIRGELSEISYWRMRLLIFERLGKFLKNIKGNFSQEHREINKNIINISKILTSLQLKSGCYRDSVLNTAKYLSASFNYISRKFLER